MSAVEGLIEDPGFLVTYAVVQALLSLALVRLIDPLERQPLSAVALFALWGATGAAVIALAGNEGVRTLLSGDAKIVFGDAVSAPVVEELAKGLALVAAILLSKALVKEGSAWHFGGPLAGAVAGAAVGIGFAFTEDFFYFIDATGSGGVESGVELFSGRRDFLGPTAFHHPLFSATLGGFLGAALWSRSRKKQALLIGFGVVGAIGVHAINNGLVELLLVREHGIEQTRAWVDGVGVSPAVRASADSANRIMLVLDMLYVATFLVAVAVLSDRRRREAHAALDPEVGRGIVTEADRDLVCRWGGRTGAAFRCLRRRDLSRLRRERDQLVEVARLAAAAILVQRGQVSEAEMGELRRRLLATGGAAHAPGRVRAPEALIVGRENEIAMLRKQLRDRRLLTLTGPAGTGKTRLAIELAAELAAEQAHGSFFVDLSGTRRPEEVPTMIAAELGVQIPSGSEPADWLPEVVRDRQLLLVLDNFEQVLGAAPVVRRLVESGSMIRVIVTSRSALGLPEETEVRVAPLPTAGLPGEPAPAVELFIDRARRAGAGAEIGAEPTELELIAGICARLDGLPLAIELVAARTRNLPVTVIAERLDSVFGVAARRGPEGDRRQGSLRNAIAWSEDLLGEPARDALRWLAELPAGVRLDLLDDAMLEVTEQLLDASMLITDRADGAPRARMFQTIRDYVVEGGEPEARAEFAERYCETLTTRLEGLDRMQRVSMALPEAPNIVAAIESRLRTNHGDKALALLCRFSEIWERQATAKARAALETACASAPPLSLERTEGVALSGRLALLQGDYVDGQRLLEQALETVSADRGDLRFDCNWNLGWIAMFTGRLEVAKAHLREAQGVTQQVDKARRARAHNALGRIEAERGNFAQAAEAIAEGERLRDLIGDHSGKLSSLSTGARLDYLAGRYSDGAARAVGALEQSRQLGDRLRSAEALFPLIAIAIARGDRERAWALCAERSVLCHELGDLLGICELLDACAQLSAEDAPSAVAAADALRRATGAQRWPHEQSLVGALGLPSVGPADHRSDQPSKTAVNSAALLDRMLAREA